MKWLFLSVGSVALLIGLITLPLPLPTGIPLLAAGTAMVYPHSRMMRSRLRLLARRYPIAARVQAIVRLTHRPRRKASPPPVPPNESQAD